MDRKFDDTEARDEWPVPPQGQGAGHRRRQSAFNSMIERRVVMVQNGV